MSFWKRIIFGKTKKQLREENELLRSKLLKIEKTKNCVIRSEERMKIVPYSVCFDVRKSESIPKEVILISLAQQLRKCIINEMDVTSVYNPLTDSDHYTSRIYIARKNK